MPMVANWPREPDDPHPTALPEAGVGWTFVYCTLPLSVMLFSVAALLGAVLLYVVWC